MNSVIHQQLVQQHSESPNPRTVQHLLRSITSVTVKPLLGMLLKVTGRASTLIQKRAEHLGASVQNRKEIIGFNPGVLYERETRHLSPTPGRDTSMYDARR